MKLNGRSVWMVGALAALCAGSVVPRAAAQQPSTSSARCAGSAGIAQLESSARAAAASSDPHQFALWKQAADAAGACAQGAGPDERGWYTYLQASDDFLSLSNESQIIAGAPAILAQLDRLLATEKSDSVLAAARSLRGDVELAYRQTRQIGAARTPVLASPEPTISPILLRGRGPIGLGGGPLGLNF